MYHRRIIFILLVFILTCSAFGGDKINESIPLPGIEPSVTRLPDGTADFGHIIPLGRPGQPALPSITVPILMNPRGDLKDVKIKLKHKKTKNLPGKWDINPVPEARAYDENGNPIYGYPEDLVIVDGKDVAIYDGSNAWPPTYIQGLTKAGKLTDFEIAEITIALATWHPVSKTLQILQEAELEISYKFDKKKDPSKYGTISHKTRRHLKKTVKNYNKIYEYYEYSVGANGLFIYEETENPILLDPDSKNAAVWASQDPAYIIVTTNRILNNSTKLDDFALSKQARGMQVFIHTIDDEGPIYGDAAAEKIKSDVRDLYAELNNPQYLLLIGDPDVTFGDVPMKLTWPRSVSSYYRDAPTDLYYADLNGNWDLDGDGLYGEGQDIGPGGVDRNYELIVGRIPCYYDLTQLDSILQKTIDYENASAPDTEWRKTTLLPMVPSDRYTPGYQLGEEIKDKVLAPEGYTWYRLYDQTYGLYPPPEYYPSRDYKVTLAWLYRDPGAVVWWTHGTPTSAIDVMSTTYVPYLDDTLPVISFQTSCYNSKPEVPQNLAHSLLGNGCVDTVAGTRVTWYYIGQTVFENSHSNAGMAFEFTKRLIGEKKEAGEALGLLKSAIDPGTYWFWQNWCSFNLYGCPAVGIVTTTQDEMITIYESGTGFNSWFSYVLDIPPAGVKFIFTNPDYLHGMMFTVRNRPDNGSYGDVSVEWYGAVDQNMSYCTDLYAVLFGNGAQINNVVTPRINGQMEVIIKSIDGKTNKVDLEIFNWRNGPGCQ